MRSFLPFLSSSSHGLTVSLISTLSKCSKRYFTPPKIPSQFIPRQMVALSIRDSEELVEEIAEAYVNMNLSTQEEFRKAATEKIIGGEKGKQLLTSKPNSTLADENT
ncbi:unnamed protein product [Phytomonas sp. Hart1]|nr:unnamed protein product [Phytomonas sp. Hart1]|eukprot:CCW72010.1 unnamed protein product [Phytomonas sp. isolate Hart1]